MPRCAMSSVNEVRFKSDCSTLAAIGPEPVLGLQMFGNRHAASFTPNADRQRIPPPFLIGADVA